MEDMFDISVVIPFFNSSSCLGRLNQSLECYFEDSKIEIIFIDDDSVKIHSDALKSYISEIKLISRCSIVYLKNERNLGASGSRKKGIDIARGNFIAFLDSDDAWAYRKLYEQYEIMSIGGYGMSGGATQVIAEIDFFSKNSTYYTCKDRMSFEMIDWKQFMFHNYYSTPSVMVKRELIRSNNFSDVLRYSEDYECWRRIILDKSCKAIKIHNAKTYSFKHGYLSNSGSLSSNLFAMSLSELKGFLMMYKISNFKIWCLLPFAMTYSLAKAIRRQLQYILMKKNT